MKIMIDTSYYSPEELTNSLYELLNATSDISVANYLRIMQLIRSLEDKS